MLKPGTTFAAYSIVRELGRGGMGEVYEAEHTGLGKRVALKVMNRLDEDDTARQRFLLEGRAAATIRHENIVDVTDVGVHDGVPFLVMELLAGESLALHIDREAPLDARRIADLMVPVAGALAAAHDAGVLHRDVKPENIFLSRTRRGAVVPKVVDFGVSRVGAITDSDSQRLTHSANLIGTPRYLAPESVLGARNAVPASDQYALGVVLYECATGAHPFTEESLFSLLWSILQATFPRPSEVRPGVDPAFEAVILRAMQRDAVDRFPSMRALAEALLPFASEDTRAHWRDEPAAASLLASASSFAPPHDPAEHAAATRDVPAVVTRAALPTPAPDSLPTLAPPARPSRALRVVGLAGAVALLCLATFLAGRSAPQAHAPRPAAPALAAPAPLATLTVAPAAPAVEPALREAPPTRPAPGIARAAPRTGRPAARPVAPVTPAPTPAAPSSPWSLRTRF